MPRKYAIYVATEKDADHRRVSEHDSYDEAHAAGLVFAQEGLDVELRTDDEICDFCSDPDVKWSHEAGDFILSDPRAQWGSRGHWAACDTCNALIKAGNRTALVKHSVKMFLRLHTEVPDTPEIRARLYEHVITVHGQFWRERTGKVDPV